MHQTPFTSVSVFDWISRVTPYITSMLDMTHLTSTNPRSDSQNWALMGRFSIWKKNINFVSIPTRVMSMSQQNRTAPAHELGVPHQVQPGENMFARWFKVPFSSPSWRSLNPLKGSLNHPKKVTLNHQVMFFVSKRNVQKTKTLTWDMSHEKEWVLQVSGILSGSLFHG